MVLGPWRSRFVSLAVVFDFQLFPVPPSKGKSIGDVLTNRQNAATWYMFFPSFTKRTACWRTPESSCVIRRCARKRKKIREIKFRNYTSLNDARCMVVSIHRQQKEFKTGVKNSLQYGNSREHCLKLCFTQRKRKYIEIKDENKITGHANFNRHSPRPIANVDHPPGPPSFSL